MVMLARRLRCAALLLLVGASAAFAQPATVVATTTYRYDEAANKVTQIDALGRTTSWTVDEKNRVTVRQLPDGTREINGYDAADNIVSKTNFAGERFTFVYDANDRLASQVVPAGTGSNQSIAASSVIFSYTATGQLASRREQGATTLDGEQSFKYDALDRVLESRSPIGVINYGRDAAGNITQRSVAGAGTAQYEYDDAGRMTRVIAPDGKQTRYSYDAAGRLDLVERDLRDRGGQAQVLVTSYRYDSADRIVTIAHMRKQGAAFALLVGQKLTRAAGGAIVQIETDRGDGSASTSGTMTARLDVRQVFEYDSIGRLTREIRSDPGGTLDTRYEYDLVGNRTRKTVVSASGAEITNYSYDVADRLLEESTTLPAGGSRVVTYTWDANGNLASKTAAGSVTLYRFDPNNRLIDIRQGATSVSAQAAAPYVRYAYDVEGNRVRKWGAEASTYLVDSEDVFAQVVREATSTGSIDYLRGLGLIRQTRTATGGSEELFPLPGYLGSSLGAVSADGDVVEQVDADAFGTLDAATGGKQTHLYAGEFWDQDAKLLYLRARWYDPSIGRFISADPFEGVPDDPRSLNRYNYAHGDPVHGLDPTGESVLAGDSGVAANVQGTLANAGQQSMQTQIRKVMLGNPKQGDFGIIGDLILDHMLESVEEVLRDKSLKGKSGQVQGTKAHALLEQKMKQLNQWIKGIPLAKDIEIKAELFLRPDKSVAKGREKGSMGIDVLVMYRGKPFAAFDLKMGSSNISNKTYGEYQRRFGARVFLVKIK